jgi:hypothetical protein
MAMTTNTNFIWYLAEADCLPFKDRIHSQIGNGSLGGYGLAFGNGYGSGDGYSDFHGHGNGYGARNGDGQGCPEFI